MVKSIEFKQVLINSELGEAYTWIELRNQIESNLLTKKLFDQWEKDSVLNLINPYLNNSNIQQCELNEQLENIFQEIRDNDSIIATNDKCTQTIILAIVEFLYKKNYEDKIK